MRTGNIIPPLHLQGRGTAAGGGGAVRALARTESKNLPRLKAGVGPSTTRCASGSPPLAIEGRI